jgi:hypothetical protein
MSQETETAPPSQESQSDNAATLPATGAEDAAPESTDTKLSAEEEQDAELDRLMDGDTGSKDDEAKSEKDEAAAPEEVDHTQPPSEDEAKAMPVRTKARIEKLLNERKEHQPLVDFATGVIQSAVQKGIRYSDLNAGIELMIGSLSGDKSADDRLLKYVRDAGILPQEQAPEADLSEIEAAVNRLAKVEYSIGEDAAAVLLDAIKKVKGTKKEAPPEKKEPEAPKADPLAAYSKAQHDRVVTNIKNIEAKYQAKHTGDWNAIRQKAYEKAAEWESKMSPEERNDITQWSGRLVEALNEVIAEKSSKKPATRPNQPLRSNNPPPTRRLPEKGTEEYDYAVLDGQTDSEEE